MGAQFWWMFVCPLQNASIIYVALPSKQISSEGIKLAISWEIKYSHK
jgi:hypothetical protein